MNIKTLIRTTEEKLQFIACKYDRPIYVILITLIATTVCLYFLTAFYMGLSPDASYYLGMVELIYDGMLPYRDFGIGYTPLVFYLLLPVRALMGGQPNSITYIFVVYLFVVASSFIVYKIARQTSANRNISLLLQLAFIVQMIKNDGLYFILEPFVLFFGLLSVWFIINNSQKQAFTFFAGLAAGAAFLCKQYGLAFIAVNVLYLFLGKKTFKDFIIKALWLAAGFMALPILFIAVFLISDTGLNQIWVRLFGNGYGQRTETVYLEGLLMLFNIFIVQVFVLLSPFYIFSKQKRHLLLYLSLIFGTALFTLQFFFQIFPHYFMLILPFVILLFAILFSTLRHFWLRMFLILSVALSIVASGKTITEKMLLSISENPLQQQQKDADNIKKHLYEDKTLYCLGTSAQKFYFLLDKKPVLMEKYGYSFGPGDTEQNVIERLAAADCMILCNNYLNPEYKYIDFTENIKAKINNLFHKVYETDEIILYIRNESME